MKAKTLIILLVILVILWLPVSIFNLFGTSRHVTVQIRHDHGAVIIDSKKVRVPYTMQETAISTHADGAIEFLFLENYGICLATSFIELIMSLLLVFILCINTLEGRLRKYRILAIKTLFLPIAALILSEICSHYVNNAWLIDTKNGINGNAGLFGINATFLNMNSGTLNLSYKPGIQLFIIPLIALAIVLRNTKSREEGTV
ncbi:MAG: hypothetical protein H7289_11185 [Mucilaginibacter sp.]|nr:hypothetical protein [Mucilaginibacter sp.]